MGNSLPTWLRVIRIAAFASAIFQIIDSFVLFRTEYTIPWIAALSMSFLLNLISVSPWFYTPRAWVWWLCYALLIWMTYNVGHNVLGGWLNYTAGTASSFLAWSANIQWMFLYGTLWSLFLVAQLVVLPFYRKLSVRLMCQPISLQA